MLASLQGGVVRDGMGEGGRGQVTKAPSTVSEAG